MKKVEPFGWWDHFNAILHRNQESAAAAERGGNKITPLYEAPPLKSNFADVAAFHEKFGLDRDRPATPSFAPSELQRFRAAFLLEELGEYLRAVGYERLALRLAMLAVDDEVMKLNHEQEGNVDRRDLVAAFDGLLDLVVVALGTADYHGFPWEDGWDAVMAANMRKKRAEPDGSDSKRGSPWDVVKPAGWYGPEAELRELLRLSALETER